MKKVLSVVLCMVMAMSMMTVSASAFDFNSQWLYKKVRSLHFIHIHKTVEKTKETCTEPGCKTTKCIICGKYFYQYSEPTGHTYDNGVVTQEATCLHNGEKTYTCTKCNHIEKQVIPQLEHSPVIDPAVEATCATPGKTEGSHCSKCGTILVKQKETDVLDCNIIEEIKAATPEKDGYERYYCTNCSYDYMKTIYRPYAIKLSTNMSDFTTEFEYTGKAIKPYVKVVDKYGRVINSTYYRTSFSNNVEIGTATVTVNFGNAVGDYYNGTMSTTFKIVAENENDTNQTDEVLLTAPSLIRAEAGIAKNTIMIYHTASKITKTYDVQYSTNKNFSGGKIVRVNANDNGSFCTSTVKVSVGAGENQTNRLYYVRMRAVNEENNAVTAWSTAKTVRITVRGSNFIF